MNKRTMRKQLNATSQVLDLMALSPMVAGSRMSRIAKGGMVPGPAQQREIQRMGREKVEAVVESWWAIASAGMRLNAQLAAIFVSACGHAPSSSSGRLTVGRAAAADKGLAPFRKRVRANAKRMRPGK